MVYRIYTEKKPGFNNEAKALLSDFNTLLNIASVEKVRLINMEDFDMSTTGEFLGFISGIISSNRDIEKIYLDSFLTTAFIDTSESLSDAVEKLKTLSEKFETDLLLSVSKKSEDIPEAIKSAVIASL